MYVRMKTSKRAKYPTMQIVEGYRDGDKVRQRTVAHLGVVKSKEDLRKLKDLADKLIQRLEQEGLEIDPKVEVQKLKHEKTVYDGFGLVVDQLMTRIGFDQVIRSAQGKRQFDLLEIVRLVLVQRFDLPASKLRTYERQEEHGFHGIDLQHIYRAMDDIEPLAEDIQKQAFEAARRLSDGAVDCFFFDVTTLYFESVSSDDLKDFGFSKDQKQHSVQIVLALVVDHQGLPIAYETFKGNLAETKTLIPVLERLRSHFSINNVTIVCDRGMASKSNIDALMKSKFNFVIATKLRSISRTAEINDLSAYRVLPGHESKPQEDQVLFRVMDHPQYAGTQLVATYSPSRAKKDRSDRERLVEKLKQKLSDAPGESSVKKVVSNGGYKKYTTVKEGSLITLNEDAIEEDAKWDGFHGLAVSNGSQLAVEQALARYHDLWRVEEAFRVAKCTLKTRPIFHYTPHRIRTHVLLCFMNLFLERYLEKLLQQVDVDLSPDRIRYALSRVHTIVFENQSTGQRGEMSSSLCPDAEKIFLSLGIPIERGTSMKKECCA